MPTVASTFRICILPYNRRNEGPISVPYRHASQRLNSFSTRISSSLKDDNFSTQKQIQVGYDHSEEFFGLEMELSPRDVAANVPKPRSWFGPNGQYIKELPCPSCRGRGYTPCTDCGIDSSRNDCSLCNGTGIMTCFECEGDCVVWEESIDERPWEKARSVSPLKVKEDDEVDNLDLKPHKRKKSKRVYQSTSPEVGLKISRSLKSLNEKTGLFSNRMRIIHQDPALHAQRVAAIKKAKRTTAARRHASETLKAFFSDTENRRKRSIAMKGIKFYCSNCGREGHRRHYCPELGDKIDKRFSCGLCGEKGHNRRACHKQRTSISNGRAQRHYRCKICGEYGHNQRTCSLRTGLLLEGVDGDVKIGSPDHKGRPKPYKCRTCGQFGHNSRTCLAASSVKGDSKGKNRSLVSSVRRSRRRYICKMCGQSGHNSRTCSQVAVIKSDAIQEGESL